MNILKTFLKIKNYLSNILTILHEEKHIIIESIILCILFTIMCYIMTKDPINMLYNYSPKIRKRVENPDEYKDIIPKDKDKTLTKTLASIIFFIVFVLLLKYVNKYTNCGMFASDPVGLSDEEYADIFRKSFKE